MSVWNLVKNCCRPHYAPIMAQKLIQRASGWSRKDDHQANRRWLQTACRDVETAMSESDRALWQESLRFAKALDDRAKRTLEELGHDLETLLIGGGHYALIHFLVTKYRPAVAVETGVAAGFSTCAILDGLQRNGGGVLYSSDFPYFRLADPERYIGLLVEEHLKQNWRLLVQGDYFNLPKIGRSIQRIDLLHYDSDKWRSGKEYAFRTLGRLIDDDTTIVIDDIQDDLFFHDLVSDSSRRFSVFEFMGKYVGVIYPAREDRSS